MSFPAEIVAAIQSAQPVVDPRDEEPDFLAGATCNPDEPEECESCQ